METCDLKGGSLTSDDGEIVSEVRSDTYIVQQNSLLSGKNENKNTLSNYYLVQQFSTCRDSNTCKGQIFVHCAP